MPAQSITAIEKCFSCAPLQSRRQTRTNTQPAPTYKDNAEQVPFVCSTLMKSYPLRTSITLENELETCCNTNSVIKPVSQAPGVWGGGNCLWPVCSVALNQTSRYKEPLMCLICCGSHTGTSELYDYGFSAVCP